MKKLLIGIGIVSLVVGMTVLTGCVTSGKKCCGTDGKCCKPAGDAAAAPAAK
jgi:hypothetical protein